MEVFSGQVSVCEGSVWVCGMDRCQWITSLIKLREVGYAVDQVHTLYNLVAMLVLRI